MPISTCPHKTCGYLFLNDLLRIYLFLNDLLRMYSFFYIEIIIKDYLTSGTWNSFYEISFLLLCFFILLYLLNIIFVSHTMRHRYNSFEYKYLYSKELFIIYFLTMVYLFYVWSMSFKYYLYL